MNLKQCFKCLEVKILSDFYKHGRMIDGHVNKCKECSKKDASKHRGENLSKIRANDRLRGNRARKGYLSEYRNNNPNVHKAHYTLNNALRSGKITKPTSCEACGLEHDRLNGHHHDYLKRLDVSWLCEACHHQWHSKNGEGKNKS